MSSASGSKQRVYVGTYTGSDDGQPGRAESIYMYDFDPADGSLTPCGTVNNVVNPSFIDIAPDKRHLYVVNEVMGFGGVKGGTVSAFGINAQGMPVFLNAQPSGGALPCFVALDATGQYALVANYGSGSVAMFPVKSDGQLDTATAMFRSEGHSVDPERQEAAHAHCVVFDPSQRYVLSADLGIDKIVMYRFNAEKGSLVSAPPVDVAPGSGPRHLAFSDDGRFLYISNELDSTISVYAWDGERGTLEHRQTQKTIPADATVANFPAEIRVVDGFVYLSNRGHNSVAVFAINAADGLLTFVETVSCGGDWPRNFAPDQTGNYLLLGNQRSDTLVVFKRDRSTGRLTALDATVSIPTPVIVKFASA